MFDLAILTVFPGLMILAAVSDGATLRIPNALILALVVTFVVMAIPAGLGFAQLTSHATAALVLLVICFALFAFNFIGGGDAKLIPATALWLGPDQATSFIVYTTLFGGALSYSLLTLRGYPLPLSLSGVVWINRLHRDGEGAPYGIAIAAGALTVYAQSLWFQIAA